MKKEYDLVYLTNTPSFYKLNLCEKISEKGVKILLVFYGYGNEAVNTVIKDNSKFNFDYRFINEGDSNSRSKLSTFRNLLNLMNSIKTKKIIFAGWLAPEYNFYSFLSKKDKNVMVCESSILDVSVSGIKGWIKRRIINRMNTILPSGTPHQKLFDYISFKGKSYITGSVGIFNKSERNIKENHSNPLKFLYVGRLIPAKGLNNLIETFNKNSLPLTIVGDGILKDQIKSKAKENINFTGFIPNHELGKIYEDHDVFILPSIYEPWGLVVEEALYRGLPVIVSDKVGSGIDMVKNLKTGLIFETGNSKDLQNKIEELTKNYKTYKNSVEKIDWEEREYNQIESYLKILK